MLFKDKMEILIMRKGLSKTDFAEKLGVTYRALANYISGARKPKAEIMKKIEEELDTTEAFLLDDSKSLILDSKERFIFHASDESTTISEASNLLDEIKKLFDEKTLSEKDKQAFFNCIAESYFNEKAKLQKIK